MTFGPTSRTAPPKAAFVVVGSIVAVVAAGYLLLGVSDGGKLDGLGGVIFGVLLIIFARFAPFGAVGTFRILRSKLVQVIPKPPRWVSCRESGSGQRQRSQRLIRRSVRADLQLLIRSDYGHSRWVRAMRRGPDQQRDRTPNTNTIHTEHHLLGGNLIMVRSKKLIAFAATGALVLAACGSDDDSSDTTDVETETSEAVDEAETETSEAMDDAETETSEAMDDAETETSEVMDDAETETSEVMDDAEASGAAFAVDVSVCDDPDAATAPIEGSITIGTSIPLSGGPAVLFAPFADGQQAYIDYYNAEFGGVNGQELELVVKDDQYTADLTVANVDELVFDDEVDVIAGDHRLAEQPGDPGRPERPVHPAAERIDRRSELGRRRRTTRGPPVCWCRTRSNRAVGRAGRR